MRKLAFLTAAALMSVAAAVSTSAAQDPSLTVISGEATVTPNKAGTKGKPQPVRIAGKVHWETPPGVERPVITGAKVLFPNGALYNGHKYPKCSLATLARRPTPSACPKGSIMGKGSAAAFADTVLTRPKITVINGGAREVCLLTLLQYPARVQTCVAGRIRKLSGKWAYELTLTVPRILQVVAGVPLQLRDFEFSAGSPKKDWLATTGCSGGRWPFEVTAFYSTGDSATFKDSLRCR
jgi:hypothetical protein